MTRSGYGSYNACSILDNLKRQSSCATLRLRLGLCLKYPNVMPHLTFKIFFLFMALVLSWCVDIYRVYKKSRKFRNGSQPREAATSMTFFVNIDCLGTCDVE